jgi:transcriptional regulator with GAF, ATPase, and Fis domain
LLADQGLRPRKRSRQLEEVLIGQTTTRTDGVIAKAARLLAVERATTVKRRPRRDGLLAAAT